MTFTFDTSLATDLALVRFHVGDTNTDGHYLEDETITALLTLKGSVGGAVIACIKYIIAQLSQPDFRLDWLTVSNATALAGMQSLLKSKAIELGVSPSGAVATSTISLPYRADSYQDSADSEHDGAP
jgi:hypothetical protein